MIEVWPCYRLVKAEWCSLSDLHDGTLTFDDVVEANYVLDAYDSAIVKARRTQKQQEKNK